MANQKIFASANHTTRRAPLADAIVVRNDAGGAAYKQSDRAALVQMVVTGTFRNSFYTTASAQLTSMLALLDKVSPDFVAKLAVYGRRQAFMKDTPAFLVAWLAKHAPDQFELAFPLVIDDGKMLKNFTQIVRSGVVGKKSLGSQAKRLVAKWIQESSVGRLLSASVGNEPSLADVIRLAHPRPQTDEQRAFFGWLLGSTVVHDAETLEEIPEGKRRASVLESALPLEVRQLVSFRRNPRGELPQVPFMLLTSLELGVDGWAAVARRATWQQLRMNLNTFARHGVFEKYPELLVDVCNRLADQEAIEKSKVTPYQLLAAVLHLEESKFKGALTKALFEAIELSCGNIPSWDGKRVAVLMDVSQSMTAPVTGSGENASKVTCAMAAALFTAVMKRRNLDAHVVLFDTRARTSEVNGLSPLGQVYNSLVCRGGGTDCGAAVRHLVENRMVADYVVMLSDNESHRAWITNRNKTTLAQAWLDYKVVSPSAKMVCIDFAPNTSVQVPDMHDVLNVGGFTDDVFRVADRFFTTGVRTNREVVDHKTLAADIDKISFSA